MNTEKQITLSELKDILKYCGYKYKEFTDYIGKSKGFLDNCLSLHHHIPFRYYDALRKYVGAENFDITLNQIRERREACIKKIEERRKLK